MSGCRGRPEAEVRDHGRHIIGALVGYALYLTAVFALVRFVFVWRVREEYLKAAMVRAGGVDPDRLADVVALSVVVDYREPLVPEWGRFLVAAVTGDWGRSMRFNEPNAEILAASLPWAGLVVLAAVGLTVTAHARIGAQYPRSRTLPSAASLYALYAGAFAALVVGLAAVPWPLGVAESHPEAAFYLSRVWPRSGYDAGLSLGVLLLLGTAFFGGLLITASVHVWLRTDERSTR